MKSRAKKMWVEALTSGEYKQICSYMRDVDDNEKPVMAEENKNMCVMGVLADLALRDAGLKITQANWTKFAGHNEAPTERTLEWAGLEKSNAHDMIDLNDEDSMSFKEFAKYIKENL